MAKKLGHFYSDDMQDWEWEIADANRFDEYVNLYISDALSDDEKFSLMELILQSVEDSESDSILKARWLRIVSLLRRNMTLHESTIRYWAQSDAVRTDQKFRLSNLVRTLLPGATTE